MNTPQINRTSPKWLKYSLRYIAVIAFIVILYVLSFGPVRRYCGTVTYQDATPTTNTVNGATIIRTSLIRMRYSHLVSVVYRPLFSLTSDGKQIGVVGLYGRYIDWCLPQAKSNMMVWPNKSPEPTAIAP